MSLTKVTLASVLVLGSSFGMSPAFAGDDVVTPKIHHSGGGSGKLYGGVTEDGGGFAIKKGHVIKIPPRVDKSATQVQTQQTQAAH